MPKNKYDSHIKPYLPDLVAWYQDPDLCCDEAVANRLGVSLSTFYKYQNINPEFAEALKTARTRRIERIVDSIYRRAIGYTVKETREESQVDSCRKGRANKVTTEKHIPGDVTAQIFLLKNELPDRFRDHHEFNVPDVTIRLTKEEENL